MRHGLYRGIFSGISVSMIFFMLPILKILDMIHWSWWLCTLPFTIPITLSLLSFIPEIPDRISEYFEYHDISIRDVLHDTYKYIIMIFSIAIFGIYTLILGWFIVSTICIVGTIVSLVELVCYIRYMIRTYQYKYNGIEDVDLSYKNAGIDPMFLLSETYEVDGPYSNIVSFKRK